MHGPLSFTLTTCSMLHSWDMLLFKSQCWCCALPMKILVTFSSTQIHPHCTGAHKPKHNLNSYLKLKLNFETTDKMQFLHRRLHGNSFYCYFTCCWLSMMAHTCNFPARGRLRQEDHQELDYKLINTMTNSRIPCLKRKLN